MTTNNPNPVSDVLAEVVKLKQWAEHTDPFAPDVSMEIQACAERIEAALAAIPEGAPVGWMYETEMANDTTSRFFSFNKPSPDRVHNVRPLYTADAFPSGGSEQIAENANCSTSTEQSDLVKQIAARIQSVRLSREESADDLPALASLARFIVTNEELILSALRKGEGLCSDTVPAALVRDYFDKLEAHRGAQRKQEIGPAIVFGHKLKQAEKALRSALKGEV